MTMPVGVRWVTGMGCPPYLVTDRGLTDAQIAELVKLMQPAWRAWPRPMGPH